MITSKNTDFDQVLKLYTEIVAVDKLWESGEKKEAKKYETIRLKNVCDLQDWFCGPGDRMTQLKCYYDFEDLYREIFFRVENKDHWNDHLEWLMPELKDLGITKRKLEEAQDENFNLKKDIEVASKTMEDFNKSLEYYQNQVRDLNNMLDSANKENRKNQNINYQLNEEMEEKNDKLNELEMEIINLKAKLYDKMVSKAA